MWVKKTSFSFLECWCDFTQARLVRNPLAVIWCWFCRHIGMGHGAHGKRSWRAQLLPPPASQEGPHPSLPKGLLGYARREKMKLLIPAFNECGSAVSLWLQSHARNSVFYFSNGCGYLTHWPFLLLQQRSPVPSSTLAQGPVMSYNI